MIAPARTILLTVITLHTIGWTAPYQPRSKKMPPFELTLNIDFHDVLLSSGSGASPEVGNCDHYPLELLERIIRLAAENGFDAINFRVDYVGWVGINGSPDRDKPHHMPLFMNTLATYDPLEEAIRLSHKNGLRCYAWLTPFDNAGREPRWSGKKHHFQSTFSFEHPEYHLCSRDGKDRFGVYCFGYPEVRDYMLTHVRNVLAYQPDGIFFSNRTHANFGRGGHKKEYGFNTPTIEEYRLKHGVDPRDEGAYDIHKFSGVLGAFYTQFLREASAEIRTAGLPCIAAVSWQSNGRIAPRLGALDKCFFQWRTWMDEGLIDTLVMGGDAATSFDSPEHVLGYMNVTADSANPEFFRKHENTGNVRIVRWVTLFDWGWKSPAEITAIAPRAFKGDVAAQMLRKVVASGADGVFLHEADNVNIPDQWKHYGQFKAALAAQEE